MKRRHERTPGLAPPGARPGSLGPREGHFAAALIGRYGIEVVAVAQYHWHGFPMLTLFLDTVPDWSPRGTSTLIGYSCSATARVH